MTRRALAMLASIALSGVAAASWAQSTTDQRIRVYVIGNGWHAGLALPAAALNTQVPGLRERFPLAQNYEVGWGDLGFYRAREITVGLAIEALFASRGSLLHVVGVRGPVESFFQRSDVVQTCVSPEQYERMARLIAQSLVVDDHGKPVPLGAGLYGDSQFYKAKGSYSLLNTCNRWTATVLQAGGLMINPRFSLTASSVLDAVRSEGSACPAPPVPPLSNRRQGDTQR